MFVLRLLTSLIFLFTGDGRTLWCLSPLVDFEWKSVKLKQMETGTIRWSSGRSISLLLSPCRWLVAEREMIAGRCTHSHGIDWHREYERKALRAYPNNPSNLMRSFQSPGIVYIFLRVFLFIKSLFDNNYDYDNTPRNYIQATADRAPPPPLVNCLQIIPSVHQLRRGHQFKYCEWSGWRSVGRCVNGEENEEHSRLPTPE